MQNYNDTIKTSDRGVFKKIPLTLFERVVCERELETEHNCNILTPTLLAITAFLSRSHRLLNWGLGAHSVGGLVFFAASYLQLVWYPTAQSGAWGLLLLCFSIASGLQTNWLPVFTELYNSSTLIFLWASQIALIQPIHGQGYNILIDRMHLLFTKVHFLFWQPGRVVGQYTTISLTFSN